MAAIPRDTPRRTAGGSLAATVVFGIAFGWVEAAVVVYLRRIYYPRGFGFPLVIAPDDLGLVEVVREVATIVMLATVARLGARTGWGRFGLFAVAFGVWDLVYYAGLWAALRWPSSAGEWDVLFLLPGIWTGPVWAPALVAVLLVACGAILHARGERGALARPRAQHWAGAAVALAAIVGAFLANHAPVYRGERPVHFPAAVFAAGVAVGLLAFGDLLRVSARSVPAAPDRA
jgi:hypothetical protein